MTRWPLKYKYHNVITHEPRALICSLQQFMNLPMSWSALNCWSQQMVYQQQPHREALLKMLRQTTSTPFFIMLRFTELGTRFRWLMPKCWLNRIKSFCSSHSKCKYIAEFHGGWKITAIRIAKINPLTFSADGFQWSTNEHSWKTPTTALTVFSCAVSCSVNEFESVNLITPQRVRNKYHAIQ